MVALSKIANVFAMWRVKHHVVYHFDQPETTHQLLQIILLRHQHSLYPSASLSEQYSAQVYYALYIQQDSALHVDYERHQP